MEVKAWGEGPLRPKEISSYQDTLGQIRAADNTAGRSATRQLERLRSRLICGIWCTPHLTGMYGTRPFLGGTGRRAVAHTRPEFAKNALGPVGIPLVRGALGAGQWTQPPSKGGKSLGGRPPEAEGNLQIPRHTRPDLCCR